ncbi:MAG TPA: MCE family protein [Mycobacteriales bacterium]|nr:MCE family protein [Mycobacteriales bacterium]
MSANRPTGGAALVRTRLAGVAFLAVLAGLIGLSIAFYNKVFTPVVEVVLEADRLGNQLTPPADVKVNGVIVGEAREVEATPEGARITLALEPEAADRIPTNVQARLLPKTLFGEKYVELVLPEDPAGQTLAAGDVIPQDRSETAREFGTALDNLLPLLDTLEPQALSTTLNNVSEALRGRGDRLGSNLVLARDFFAEFNPELPRLQRNLSGTADFADTLTAATPDILALLEDLSVVNTNLVRDEAALDRFLRASTGVSQTLEEFVRENEQRFVALAREGRAPLELFETYAPSYPCLAQGLAESDLFIGDSFGRLQPGLHITLEFTSDQGGYQPLEDEPAYLHDRGPDCFGLPRPPVPDPGFDFRDGAQRAGEEPAGPQQTYPDQRTGAPTSSTAAFAPAAFSDGERSRTVVNAVVAPVLGVGPDRVPDVAHLLFGPVARGTVVGLSDGTSGRSAS